MEMWLILAGIAILVLCLITTLFVLLVYSGLLESVEVGAGRPPIGAIVIAYKFARGPYKESGPLFCELTSIAPKNKCLGIYYDPPSKVEAHRLRYAVASVLAEDGQEVDEQLKKKFEEEGYKIMELPKVENVVRTSFPYRSAFSIVIAVQKVYPKMLNYIQEHKLCAHPCLEVYVEQTIHYMAPLSRQGDFYVPEALQTFPGEEPYETVYSEFDGSLQEISQSQSEFSSSADDSQTEPSLLESPQMVRAVYLGQEASEKAASESGEEKEEEPVKSPVVEGAKEEPGTDEESSSSFEDLKVEAEREKDSPQ